MNVAFNDNKSFSLKKEKKRIIDNLSLLEPAHEYRLKEVSYNQDFVIVPK